MIRPHIECRCGRLRSLVLLLFWHTYSRVRDRGQSESR